MQTPTPELVKPLEGEDPAGICEATSDYSIGYIAAWSKCDTATMKSTASNVLNTAHTIMTGITETEASMVA